MPPHPVHTVHGVHIVHRGSDDSESQRRADYGIIPIAAASEIVVNRGVLIRVHE
jgi:hypothetical protein